MPADPFDQVDAELVGAIADLQDRAMTISSSLSLAAFAAGGLANRADERGDVHRVHGLERAADRLRQAAALVTSAASVLRMVEHPDEWPQERPAPAAVFQVPDHAPQPDNGSLGPMTYPAHVLAVDELAGRLIRPDRC